MESRYYLRLYTARRVYICAACGKPIKKGVRYFRHEPHPMARRHRGATTKHLCTVCVTGHQPWDLVSTMQMRLPFVAVLDHLPGMLLQTAVVQLGEKTEEGHIVQAVALAWFEIITQVSKNPDFLSQVRWRKLEEIIAGAYEKEGWDEVILTPPSSDGGRDVIAVKKGICRIRIIDQVKAYAPGQRVSANDVRALIGVLASDQNVSKGFVTTTAEFAPKIYDDPSINQFIPYRLELRDGDHVRNWLLQVANEKNRGV
jgi:restriction system protein